MARRAHAALGAAAVLLLALAGWALWPRTAHLRDFDPHAVARLETAMWRHYYDERYVALLADLYALSRNEYGFSPADSLAIAWHAARAAAAFQPTRSRAEAARALPSLERYFDVLRTHGGERFDVQAAARAELEWWQRRRESATAMEYGELIALTTGVVFGRDNAATHEAARTRAAMMAYRDERRDGRMQAADWDHIEAELDRSYRALRAGLTD